MRTSSLGIASRYIAAAGLVACAMVFGAPGIDSPAMAASARASDTLTERDPCIPEVVDRDMRVRGGGYGGVVAMPAPAPPPAMPRPSTPAQAHARHDKGTSETVVVTGARLPQTNLTTVSPVTSVTGSVGVAGRDENTERYPHATPNPVHVTSKEPVSTFSADVDTASYANVRRFLCENSLPPADAVRVEEMINYFDYGYATPRDRNRPFQPTVAVYPTPWNKDTMLLHIGIKGYDIPQANRPRANLVFLIDSSGSMQDENKLPLLRRSFALLVNQLRPDDHVAIVVYAGSAGTVLEPTPGSNKEAILAALSRLEAGGSTAGGEGIRQAYQLAEAHFEKGAVNRVILATDGDFNVGVTDNNTLEDFVARKRATGIFLSVLGFGEGNYQDERMQKLAQAGNGVAYYIDTYNEARKVFVNGLFGTLFTIAKDVKFQVEFNPARVAEYRLIGYETRILNETDFNNDRVDAGDIGSGHTVTAIYEITPVGSPALMHDPSRYNPGGNNSGFDATAGEYAFLKMRYKLPNEDTSHLITRPITAADVQSDFGRVPADLRFAAAVAGAAQLLRHDPYIKAFDFDRAIGIASGARGADTYGYRTEFIGLLRHAKTAAAMKPLEVPTQ